MNKNYEMSRRQFVSNAGKAVVGASFLPYIGNAKTIDNPPNIIFVICDQMRGDAISAMGNRNARTPVMDSMSKNGVMMRNNFSNNSVCLPSRVSMFSGRYPHETGIINNSHKGEWLKFNNSLPWYLKQAGYRTGYVGKNHTFINSELANFDKANIRDREECRAYSKYVPPQWHTDIFWPDEDCHPRKNTNDAIEFINQNSPGQPFFLCVSYFDPHPPYMAPSEYTSRYCSANIELPEYVDPSKLGIRIANQQRALRYDKISESELKETLRYYHATVEWGVDYQLGRIIKYLEEKGIANNTIMVFTSDHGDFMGHHHMVRKGMFLYDALLHVPMIWYAPGNIRQGLAIDSMTQNVDIFPTLLDFAGIEIPGHLSGRSLKNILQGKPDKNDNSDVFAYASYSDLPESYWDNPEPYFNPKSEVPFHTRIENLTWQDDKHTAMIRDRNWKLILSETHEPELYNMEGRHTETQNLYGQPQYRQKFIELEKKLNAIKKW